MRWTKSPRSPINRFEPKHPALTGERSLIPIETVTPSVRASAQIRATSGPSTSTDCSAMRTK